MSPGPTVNRSRLRLLRRLGSVVGCAVAALALLLVVDGLVERRRLARETAQIEVLEQRVLTDAGTAEELAVARSRQTERSVARQKRNRRLAWTLLVGSVVFLALAKSAQALAPTRGPRRAASELVSLGDGTSLIARRGGQKGDRGAAPQVNLTFVDEVVARLGGGREAAIPILQALQTHYRYLPASALRRVCELTEVTPADLLGVATFYSQFRRRPVGRHLVRICHGTACHVAGIEPITDELRRRLEIPAGDDSDAALRFTLDPVNCLGCCSLAPVMMVDDRVAGRLTPTSACDALAAAEVGG